MRQQQFAMAIDNCITRRGSYVGMRQLQKKCRLSAGQILLLCNVGGDNVLTVEFVEQCLCVACRSKSGEVGRAQFHSHLQRGAYGRIMFGLTLVHKLAGCDEETLPCGRPGHRFDASGAGL